ncbi:MAG: LPXTG cell wall anchor domain-containing protein [Acutalibacteraceae bacterium]
MDTGPETGDHSSWILLVSMLLTSAAALAGTAAFLKRKAK